MKKEEKQGLLILIVVAILVITIIWFATRQKNKAPNEITDVAQEEYTKVEADGTVVNTSEKLKENKEEQGFLITNIEFKQKDGETTFTASITNKTGSNQESFLGNIVLLDKSGKEIGRIPVRLSDMQIGESIDVEAIIRDAGATMTEGYANAYNFKLER